MAADLIDQAAGLGQDDDAGQDDAGQQRGNRLGRALDMAGIAAGVILGVILFDILSGGKLTRWARARRGPGPEGKSGPCEGCGGDGPADDN